MTGSSIVILVVLGVLFLAMGSSVISKADEPVVVVIREPVPRSAGCMKFLVVLVILVFVIALLNQM